MKSPLRWLRARRWRTVLLALALLLILLNVLAYRHAWAMTHYVPAGDRTGRPESLSRWEKVGVLLSGITVPRPANQATPESVGLAFTVHQIPTPEEGRLEAWHLPHPEAPNLILMFPGYASCKGQLLREARAFHEMGHAVLLVDFRGSGGSTGSATTIGVAEADDVAAAWAYARQQWPDQRLILYGKSMGSAAILRAIALLGVQPAAAILECPFDRLLATVQNRFAAFGIPAFPLAPLMVFWGGVQQGFNGFQHNPAEYARAVPCPVLLLHGDADPRVTRAQLQTIHDQLAGDKKLVWFTGLGHQSYLAAQPEAWRQAVGPFLAERR